ncbi:MAG: hypothetical protein ACK411_00700 [Exiguobacterium mexicanum]
MSTRRLIWALLICIAIVVVFSGIGSYFYERQQLKRYLADNDFHAYEYLKTDDATLALFTNNDENLLGIAEMSTDGYGYGTIEILDPSPFDYIYSSDGSNYYLGVRLNERPQDVSFIQITGDHYQERHSLNDIDGDDFSTTHIIILDNAPKKNFTLQTLNQHGQVLDTIH